MVCSRKNMEWLRGAWPGKITRWTSTAYSLSWSNFLDMLYLSVIIFIRKKKLLHIVANHHIFSIPGMKFVSDVLQITPGSQEECRKVLENGELLIISPGGVREALFSDENYTIIWRNRKGFAQVAIDTKVPIIPTFTQNIRENIRVIGGQIKLLRSIYEYLRLPVFLLYGNFPVKLQTYFGDPIPYDPNITAEELAKKTNHALRCLIDKHQKIPGNVWRALMERVTTEEQDNE
ncbi:hypothetical protein E2320_011376 [Naja naja]|nr:hypothetical protein E2320_011376 [Naja naja]